MNLAALGLTADELQALFDLILQRGATDARDGDWKWEVVATIAQLWLAVQNDRLHIPRTEQVREHPTAHVAWRICSPF